MGFEPTISAWKADVLPLTLMAHNIGKNVSSIILLTCFCILQLAEDHCWVFASVLMLADFWSFPSQNGADGGTRTHKVLTAAF